MQLQMKGISKNHTTLNATGMRATNQRALILDIIRKEQGHLDADEVYRQARKKLPLLSLSTVYRTLRLFKKLDLVEEIHFDEAHHHYEAKQATEHHHLFCLGCGKVVEFTYPLSHHVKRNIAEAEDFDIIEIEMRMTGFCPKCCQDRQ